MKSGQPPIVASWILEHLVPGGRKDALAGDLLEEFARGRTAGWYWRQVMAALVLGSLQELRAHRSTVAFAIAWTVAAQAFWSFGFWRAAHDAAFMVPWPYSAIFGMTALVIASLWVGVVVYAWLYALLGRRLRFERVARGLWMGPLLFVGLSTATRIMAHPLGVGVAGLDAAKLILYCFSLLVAAWGIRPQASAEPMTAG